MKQLKIVWHKELKNCVPFYIYVNGAECGIIKRGEECLINVPGDIAEVYLVPKAPKWFGWKALRLNTVLQSDFCELNLAVQIPNGSLLGKLGEAANVNNQLHCTVAIGVIVNEIEYIKKYK